jgi:hypothetical protein
MKPVPPSENTTPESSLMNHRTLLRLMLALLVMPAIAAADSLQVGTVFPATKFQLVDDDGFTSLASISDVQRRKAIVFIFASW